MIRFEKGFCSVKSRTRCWGRWVSAPSRTRCRSTLRPSPDRRPPSIQSTQVQNRYLRFISTENLKHKTAIYKRYIIYLIQSKTEFSSPLLYYQIYGQILTVLNIHLNVPLYCTAVTLTITIILKQYSSFYAKKTKEKNSMK